MAEDKSNPESLLSRAKEQEKRYVWLDAADTYGRTLEAFPKGDVLGIGRAQEAAAHALFRAAMQAENTDEFKNRVGKSEALYQSAKEAYAKASSSSSTPLTSRCEAMIAYLGFWQASDAATKKKKVGDAWSFAKKAMDVFDRNQVVELTKTFNQLLPSAVHSVSLSESKEFRGTTLREVVEYSERIVNILSDNENRDDLATVLIYTAESLETLNAISDVKRDEFDSNHEKASEYWRRATGLSEEAALVAVASTNLSSYGVAEIIWRDYELILKRQLEYAKSTSDRYSLGITYVGLASYYLWESSAIEDPEDVKARLDQVLRYAHEGRKEFGKIGCLDSDYENYWVSGASQSWYYHELSLLETDLTKKRDLTMKALEEAQLESEAADKLGFPDVVRGSRLTLMTALVGLAKMTSKNVDKARLLEQALVHGKDALRFTDLRSPGFFWGRGSARCVLGTIELELADATDNVESRRESLRSAIVHMRDGMNLISEHISWRPSSDIFDEAFYSTLSLKWSDYGRALRRSYALDNDRGALVDSATAFEKAAGFSGRAGQPSRVAENLWEAAQVYDALGDHLKASKRFEGASQQYGTAAEKISRLNSLFLDESLYMRAWSEIEKARYHHARQEPALAKEDYRKAAELHESSEKWRFLSTNYFAWSQVENAEDLSQKERSRESVDAFREAAKLLGDSKRAMLERVSAGLDSPDEKQMVESLIRTADYREEICEGRITLEEAKLLDREGDLGRASEKYGLVADVFVKIGQRSVAEQNRTEIDLIVTLSKAWKAMAKAEAESSPDLYEEAARLFNEAKDLSPGDKAKNLALGHSRLCMALSAGDRYADTSDPKLHASAAQNLESAAKYYLKADMQSAAEYAKASKLLFDSYAYVGRASSEEDQEKKTKLYTMAEKVLQASVSSFEKAGQLGRKEQVLKILAKVKEDRELAVSLAEVFLAPDIVSTTMAFSSPALANETAVGLDGFEHANVQATLIAKPKELHVGQELNLEIELVNAGRGPAQLTKVEETVPKGFVIVQEPEKYRVEDSQINLRGRRLDALKTEDLRLVLKSTAKGSFKLKPRIRYLDDSGTDKSCEPAAVEVVVKEMGISGWIRGT